ncbi:MAG: hypothetical protein IIA64_01065 [Planctomycetes bacterium]|nr:hypothetical protein [Planctomycetota bacterium]
MNSADDDVTAIKIESVKLAQRSDHDTTRGARLAIAAGTGYLPHLRGINTIGDAGPQARSAKRLEHQLRRRGIMLDDEQAQAIKLSV